MPVEPRLFIKTGMVYLGLTFLVGAALAVAEALRHPLPAAIAIEHAHAGFVGWLVNVVIGVALWMFPLDAQRFPESKGRYPVGAVLTAYVALNVGLPMRLVAEPWLQLASYSPLAGAVLVVGALAQLVAVVIAGAVIWRRIKPPSRPAPGVR